MKKVFDLKIIVSMLLLGASGALIYLATSVQAQPEPNKISYVAKDSQKFLAYTIQASKFKFERTQTTFDIVNGSQERVKLNIDDYIKGFLDNWIVLTAGPGSVNLAPPEGCNFLRIDLNYVEAEHKDISSLVSGVVCLANDVPVNLTTIK